MRRGGTSRPGGSRTSCGGEVSWRGGGAVRRASHGGETDECEGASGTRGGAGEAVTGIAVTGKRRGVAATELAEPAAHGGGRNRLSRIQSMGPRVHSQAAGGGPQAG